MEKYMNMHHNPIVPVLLGIALVVVLVLPSATSCTYHINEEEPVVVPDSVFFSTDIIPIFDARCNNPGCHSANAIPPDLTAANAYNSLTLFGYVDTDNPEESVLYEAIAPGGSMEALATNQDRALILKWIEQGAQNN